MFNLDTNAFRNIRAQFKSDNPSLGQYERALTITLLVDRYEVELIDDEPERVAAYHEDLMSKSNEDLLFLLHEKGLL